MKQLRSAKHSHDQNSKGRYLKSELARRPNARKEMRLRWAAKGKAEEYDDVFQSSPPSRRATGDVRPQNGFEHAPPTRKSATEATCAPGPSYKTLRPAEQNDRAPLRKVRIGDPIRRVANDNDLGGRQSVLHEQPPSPESTQSLYELLQKSASSAASSSDNQSAPTSSRLSKQRREELVREMEAFMRGA